MENSEEYWSTQTYMQNKTTQHNSSNNGSGHPSKKLMFIDNLHMIKGTKAQQNTKLVFIYFRIGFYFQI